MPFLFFRRPCCLVHIVLWVAVSDCCIYVLNDTRVLVMTHRRWLQNILPWRRWEEKWSWSYTEGRLHRESVRGEESF